MVSFTYLRPLHTTLPLPESLLAQSVEAALRGDRLWLRAVAKTAWDRVVTLTQRVADHAIERLATRLDLVESHAHLVEWWTNHVRVTREYARNVVYRPRHSRERLDVDPLDSLTPLEDIMWRNEFRTYWAEWPTQFWPCLATEGDAYFTVDVSTCAASYDWGDHVSPRTGEPRHGRDDGESTDVLDAWDDVPAWGEPALV